MNWYEQAKMQELRSKQAAFVKTESNPSFPMRDSSTMIRIRKRSTFGSVMSAFIQQLADQFQKASSELEGAVLEMRGDDDPGFRFTKFAPEGEAITFFVDCSFSLAPEHIRINMKGAKGTKNFSDNIRMFMTDPMMNIARRMAGRLKTS